jgi:plasmid stabilization system protein ParE
MSTRVILRPLAQAEFDSAANWYEQRRAGLGAAFTSAVRKVMTTIAATPDRYPAVYQDVREAAVSRYPYAVYYRIESNQVIVLAVFHTSRDPDVWHSRS